MTAELTLGPVLYNWEPEIWRDFYFEVADEAPVKSVYLGEVICSKRAPLFDAVLEEVIDRLERANKKIIFSTLSEVTNHVDQKLIKRVAAAEEIFVEANDVSALWHIAGRPHAIGPFMNTFNEESLAFFAENGATSMCLPTEIPAEGIKQLAKAAATYGVDLEVQIFGRIPLALSARCYHARAHDRTKDSCQYVCDKDPDGMVLKTLEGKEFLTINGIQTLSFTCLNLVHEIDDLIEIGVKKLRVSPQSTGTLKVIDSFDRLLKGELNPVEANKALNECGFDAPFSNGFFHHQPGYEWHV